VDAMRPKLSRDIGDGGALERQLRFVLVPFLAETEASARRPDRLRLPPAKRGG
jgi:hypothetical protein